jgi:hypothetical protein
MAGRLALLHTDDLAFDLIARAEPHLSHLRLRGQTALYKAAPDIMVIPLGIFGFGMAIGSRQRSLRSRHDAARGPSGRRHRA